MRPGYVSHIFLVFICKYFLKANSNQAFTDWKSTAGSVFNERSVGIQVSYCFCLSLRTRMIHFSDTFGLMNCRMKILQLFKKKKKQKQPPFLCFIFCKAVYYAVITGNVIFLLCLILDSVYLGLSIRICSGTYLSL